MLHAVIPLLRPGAAACEHSRLDPEPAAAGAPIDLQIQSGVKEMPKQQGGLALRTGGKRTAKNPHTIATFHLEKRTACAWLPRKETSLESAREPEPTAAALASRHAGSIDFNRSQMVPAGGAYPGHNIALGMNGWKRQNGRARGTMRKRLARPMNGRNSGTFEEGTTQPDEEH